MENLLVLVDNNDKETGKLEKTAVHRLGLLHRAFSIFIFNTKGELLLQQRAAGKYHSGGLWTNTCCSHPVYGEDIDVAVKKRLKEEMGLDCKLKFIFSFIYKAKLDNGLTEHEFDHVYFGITDTVPVPDQLEVRNWKYMDLDFLEKEISLQPELFTKWLQICLPEVKDNFKKYNHQ